LFLIRENMPTASNIKTIGENDMQNDKNEKDVRKLFGPILKNVRDGERILTFIEKLAAERDALEERQKHLTSLTRLFEKTVYDADDLAVKIKKEAEEKAKAEAGVILNQADEQIGQIVKEKSLEIMKKAEAEAQQTREKFRQELEAKLREKKAALQALIREHSMRLCNEMIIQTENFKKQAASLELDIQNSLSSFSILTDPSVDSSSEPGENVGDLAKENADFRELFADEKTVAEVSPEIAQQKRIELEILPPRDKEAMEEIRTYIAGLEEVSSVDLRHLTDKTIVEIVLSGDIDVIKALSVLSQVEQIQEVVVGGQKKIQIILSVHSEIEKEKDRLNMKANRIASRGASLT
jgi:hypothetical protein